MSSIISCTETPILDLYVLKRRVFHDPRGYFFRLFCQDELEAIGLSKPFVQINVSHTKTKFTTRGFHFQYPPHTETKIVTCTRGEVYDIAIDLRRNSPTFMHWYGITLSEKNNLSFYIPDGFAHGFQSMTDNSDLLYMHTHQYCKESEGGLNVLDPLVGVKWPNAPENLSSKDLSFSYINTDFKGLSITKGADQY